MHAEKDAHIWKSPEIDRAEQEEIKKYTTKDHKVNMGLIICSYELLNIDLPSYYQNSGIKLLRSFFSRPLGFQAF